MAKKTLIISDVTAMKGNSVCIAGYDTSLRCIRPVLSIGQINRRHLFKDGELIIYPGAKVSFYFRTHNPHPPHIEDYIFDENSIENEGKTSNAAWKEILSRTAIETFSELFPDMEERYAPHGVRGPSIGTLIPKEAPTLRCYYYGTPRPRMKITDYEGTVKEGVPITDLAFKSYFDFLMGNYKGDCEKAVKFLNGELIDRSIYLRLGLSRPFSGAPGKYSGWCCLQVNGIHTFPDLYDREYKKWIRLE